MSLPTKRNLFIVRQKDANRKRLNFNDGTIVVPSEMSGGAWYVLHETFGEVIHLDF